MPPLVQQATVQTEFSSQSQDIVTTIHPLHSSDTEFLGISLMPFSFHFAVPFLQSVFCESVSIRVSVHVFADPHGEALSRIRRDLTVVRLFEVTDRFTSQMLTAGQELLPVSSLSTRNQREATLCKKSRHNRSNIMQVFTYSDESSEGDVIGPR